MEGRDLVCLTSITREHWGGVTGNFYTTRVACHGLLCAVQGKELALAIPLWFFIFLFRFAETPKKNHLDICQFKIIFGKQKLGLLFCDFWPAQRETARRVAAVALAR
jgi:hypothetical protein